MTRPSLVMHERNTDFEDLTILGTRVSSALNLNTNYASPIVTIPALNTAVADVVAAIGAWGDVHNRGSHGALLDLKAKAITLHNDLHSEMMWCEATALQAAGNDYAALASILNTSGFDLKMEGAPVGPLQAVQNFHQFISPTLSRNQCEIKWHKPLNTQFGNINTYDVYIADTNDFSLAVHLISVKKTHFIFTNDTTSAVNKVFWIVPRGSALEGARSAALPISILGI